MDEYPKCPVRDKTNTEESPFSLLLASRTEVSEVLEPLAPTFGDTPSIPIGCNRLQPIGKFGVATVLD